MPRSHRQLRLWQEPIYLAKGIYQFTKKEFLQFLSVARGSPSDLETQVILAKELGCIKDNRQIMERIVNVFGLLGGLIRSLKSRSPK